MDEKEIALMAIEAEMMILSKWIIGDLISVSYNIYGYIKETDKIIMQF